MTRIYDKKDKKREEYYKQLLEFEEQQEMIAALKMLYAQKKRHSSQADERQRRIDARKAEIEGRGNPNVKKIATCNELINYCQRLKVKAGLVQPTADEVAAKA